MTALYVLFWTAYAVLAFMVLYVAVKALRNKL